MESLRAIPQDQREEYVCGLTRVELQKAAKEAGLKANVKSSILVASLLEKLACEEDPVKEDVTEVTLTANESLPESLGGEETGSLQKHDSVKEVRGTLPEGSPLPSPAAGGAQSMQFFPSAAPTSEDDFTSLQSGVDAEDQLLVPPLVTAEVLEQTVPGRDEIPEQNGEDGQPAFKEDPTVACGSARENPPPTLGTPDFEECFSQTLQNAVASLEPTKSMSLADCLGTIGSLQDQQIDLISISPLVKEHCVSVRPSPWMHGHPPAAPPAPTSVDLDVIIAAADTAFADCCEETAFVDMALQDPLPSPSATIKNDIVEQISVDTGNDVSAMPSMPTGAPSAKSSAEGESASGAINPEAANTVRSPAGAAPWAACNIGQVLANQKYAPLTVQNTQASTVLSGAPMVSPFAALSHGRDDQNGATLQMTLPVQNEDARFENNMCPGQSAPGSRCTTGADECPAAHSPAQDASDLRSYSRGRDSGIWEGRNMADLQHLQQQWDTLKQSSSGRSWSLPSIAEVQAKSHQLAASGFTTVDSPKMRPSSRLLVAMNATEDRKRQREPHPEDKESAPKRPTLGAQYTTSRLAKPGREPLKAIDKSNTTVPAQTPKEKSRIVSGQKAAARQGNTQTLPGPRIFGLPASGAQSDRRKPTHQSVKGRSGIPSFRPGK